MSSTNQSNQIAKTSHCLAADDQNRKRYQTNCEDQPPEQVEECKVVTITHAIRLPRRKQIVTAKRQSSLK